MVLLNSALDLSRIYRKNSTKIAMYVLVNRYVYVSLMCTQQLGISREKDI